MFDREAVKRKNELKHRYGFGYSIDELPAGTVKGDRNELAQEFNTPDGRLIIQRHGQKDYQVVIPRASMTHFMRALGANSSLTR